MRFFLSAGEVSGDKHLSYLVQHISKLDNKSVFFGVAGRHSLNAGVEVIQDIEELAVMGFTQVLSKYFYLKKKAAEYIEFIKKEKIDIVILVDYGGFNIRFLDKLKIEVPDVKVYYYIPPKVWIWGENRIEKLKKADYILAVFPWEREFYLERGVEVYYFGNPLVDIFKFRESLEGKEILLLPGSRKQEIKKLTPIMLEIVKLLPEEKFILKLESEKNLEWIEEDLRIYTNLKVEYNKELSTYSSKVKFAIAASGTVTLELALMGIPAIVGYKVNFFNEMIARLFLNIKFVSLPNITLNSMVYPELLQGEFKIENIMREINLIEKDERKIIRKLIEVRDKLGGDDIIKKYAEFILENR